MHKRLAISPVCATSASVENGSTPLPARTIVKSGNAITQEGARLTAESDAIARVREYVQDRGLDMTGYSLSQMQADRPDVGWMAYVPVSHGEIAVGRATCPVADAGVVVHSSSIAVPSYAPGFEKRHRRRRGSPA
ncbi:hypothetical protein ABZV91_27080 [Nocardia sp. NPDC004568]|uniref:hypothetical protein n=1 Tax=Nocardia sp. NPDC004568 TaxID=3154551 RepID=UPI0033AA2D08